MYDQAYTISKDDSRITGLFRKTFPLVMNENYSLPCQESMFKESSWSIQELQNMKDELNAVKDLLNSYNLSEWNIHTNRRSKANLVRYFIRKENIQPEFITQAWCKFYEILSAFDVIPENEIIKNNNSTFTSVHLCEAPGAFIASLNHWLKTNTTLNWNWIATTLNPYYEGNPLSRMINDDRFIRNTLDHWYFGEDNTGNLMNLKNLNEFIKQAKKNDNILLITADGSIDCIDVPGEQETVVFQLQYCETIAALHLLSKGGSFIIKIFTTFEHSSICLLYLLSCCFDKVVLKKPATSKEGNSETYVVCMNFKGIECIISYLPKLRKYYESGPSAAIFCKNDIPPDFIAKVIKSTQFFKEIQISVILDNIMSFSVNNGVNNSTLNELRVIQELVAEKYINDYNLKKLPSHSEIIGKDVLSKTVFIDSFTRRFCESYDKRREKANMKPKDRLIAYWNFIRKIFDEIPIFEPKNFQFCNENVFYDFIIGKTFYKIYNSGFCETRILTVQIDIEDILDKLHLAKRFPSNEDTEHLLQMINKTSNYKTLTFRYTGLYCSRRTISKFCELLPTLLDGDSLVLIGYSLLTCFNVSFLYLLNCTFHSLKFQPHDKVGCLIILKRYKKDPEILQMLKKITVIEGDSRKESKTILSFIPITDLYGWAAYPKIVKCNHWIVKTYLNYVMDSV